MAPQLARMPVMVINLKKDEERKRNMGTFLNGMGCRNIEFLEAHDAQQMVISGGRSKRESKSTWRVTYDDLRADGSYERVTWNIKGNTLAASGAADFWSQHGCSRSHFDTLQWAKEQLQHCQAVMICEDDCAAGQDLTLVECGKKLRVLYDQLSAKHPSWCCLLLGGVPLAYQKGENGPSRVPGIHKADYVFQAHCIIWKASSQTDSLIDVVSQKIKAGLISDNAYAATMKQWPGKFFYVVPSLVIQDADFGSKLQLGSASGANKGYTECRAQIRSKSKAALSKAARAKMPKAYSKALGSDRRGAKKVRRRPLKRMRATLGARGGKTKAGNGSSAEDIKNKEKKMVAWRTRHGTWPSKTLAHSNWKISSKLWARVKKDHPDL